MIFCIILFFFLILRLIILGIFRLFKKKKKEYIIPDESLDILTLKILNKLEENGLIINEQYETIINNILDTINKDKN